jgi:hypothetical protein
MAIWIWLSRQENLSSAFPGWLRLYSKSHFLEHLARDTGAHTKSLLHFKVACKNHIVDVVSEEQPTIEIIPL